MAAAPNLIKTGQEIAFETILEDTINDNVTLLELTSSTGLPTANFTLILDYDVAESREAVAVESRDGNICTLYSDGRGWDSTSAHSHTGGTCKVRATILPSMIDKIIDAIKEEHDDDGKHDSAKVASLSSGAMDSQWNGWILANETWVYASATTITVPTGAASRYQKGDKFKLTANSVELFGYIVTVADTLLTVVGNALTDHTFTANYYSKVENPQGFPQWANLTVGVGRATNLSIGNASWTGVDWNLEYMDVMGLHDNSTNPSRIGIPVTGDYLIGGIINFAVNATGRRLSQIKKNDTVIPYALINGVAFASGEGIISIANVLLTLTAGDYIEVNAYQSSGAALNITAGNSQLWLHKIG